MAATAHPQLSHREPIAAQPPFTKSPWYISPAEAEPRFARAADHDYTSPFSSDLDAYFADSRAARRQHRSEALTTAKDTADDADTEDEDFRSIPSNRQTDGDGDDTPDAHHYDQKFHDDEYARIRSASRQQEKEIVAHDPKLCKIRLKDGMECSVCKNPKTGSHSEQCSFSSTAPAKKYAYTKERNYNSRDADDDADDDDADDSSDEEVEQPVKKRKVQPKKPAPKRPVKKPTKPNKSNFRRSQPLRAADDNNAWRPILAPLRFRSSYAAQASERHARVVAAEPFLFGVRASEALSADGDSKPHKRNARADDDDDEATFSFERFFARDFPEAKSAGLIRAAGDGADGGDDSDADDEPVARDFRPDYGGKQSVERVLAEFKQRDWSQCERRRRDSLTCYLCHDEHGVRHEECMFVAGGGDNDGEGEPKKGSSRLAYTETKEYHSDDDDDDDAKEDDSDRDAAPTKRSKTKTKSARLQAAAADDDGEDDDDDGRKLHQTSRRSRTTKRKVAVTKRFAKPDVGVHQASGGGQWQRSIKRRQNADEATATGVVQPAAAAYAHTVRH